jgi:hypothetical protein
MRTAWMLLVSVSKNAKAMPLPYRKTQTDPRLFFPHAGAGSIMMILIEHPTSDARSCVARWHVSCFE